MQKKTSSKKRPFSTDAIVRISMYLRNLKRLQQQDVKVISSTDLAKTVNVTPDQLRKDLSYFGGFGKRGVGYDVEYLIKRLENILGVDSEWKIALAGVGRIGGALLNYPGFGQEHLTISVAFDVNPDMIGTTQCNVPIEDLKDLPEIVKKENIKVGILCVHSEFAQEVADMMMDAGIKAILNFAPVNINIREDVYVSRVDMFSKLESLIFFVNQELAEI